MRGSNKNQDATDAPTAKVGSGSRLPQENALDLAVFLQSGWRVAFAFLAPSLLGVWLDNNLGTNNIFTICGVTLGFVLVKVVVYKFVKTRYYAGGDNK